MALAPKHISVLIALVAEHASETASSALSQEQRPHCVCCCISYFGVGNRVRGGGFGYKAAAGAELQGTSSQPGSHQFPKEPTGLHGADWFQLETTWVELE